MKVKKAGHIHNFGVHCAICHVNNPEAHRERKRKTRRERVKKLPAFTFDQWRNAHFGKLLTKAMN